MTDSKPRLTNRRKALRDLTGIGAIAGMLPLLGRFADEQSPMSLIPAAYAQGAPGVGGSQGNVAFITAAKTPAVPMAEWEPKASDSGAEVGRFRIAHGEDPVSKAPPEASRYAARAYDFPGGSLRVLTWKKGVPVAHQITYETEIMVLEGTVTLTPPYGIEGPTATLRKGDALFMPSGTLRNMKTTSDTVILQAFVASTADKPNASIVYGKDLKEALTVNWMDAGKPMTANNAKDAAKAPKNAARFTVKRYAFDGNSMRWAKLVKGGTTNTVTTGRTDVLIYIAKGRMKRTEGNETLEVVAGDVVRELQGNPGHWEILEDSEFIATDAPLRANAPNPFFAPGTGMKLMTMINDHNGRSAFGFADVAMKKVSETESISEKQAGAHWRIGPRKFITPYTRTHKAYKSNTGPYEQHSGGAPHFTGCMSGNVETTAQDGMVLRRNAGDFCFITPGALHHSSFRSEVEAVYFNLYVPGTDKDTATPKFK